MSAATRMNPADLFMLGTLFKISGGAFAIDSNGQRCIFTAFECCYPPERAEYQTRVTTMLEGLLKGLCDEDKAFLFDAFAEVAIDPENITATFAEPMRRAA